MTIFWAVTIPCRCCSFCWARSRTPVHPADHVAEQLVASGDVSVSFPDLSTRVAHAVVSPVHRLDGGLDQVRGLARVDGGESGSYPLSTVPTSNEGMVRSIGMTLPPGSGVESRPCPAAGRGTADRRCSGRGWRPLCWP